MTNTERKSTDEQYDDKYHTEGVQQLSPEMLAQPAPPVYDALTDDAQEPIAEDLVNSPASADELLYGGAESDFDREYFDNSDTHEYYDEPEKTDYHPHD